MNPTANTSQSYDKSTSDARAADDVPCKSTSSYNKMKTVRYVKYKTGAGVSCTYCGKWFAFKADADRHLRTHTGERPFKCHLCSYAAAQRITLVTHISCKHKSDHAIDIEAQIWRICNVYNWTFSGRCQATFKESFWDRINYSKFYRCWVVFTGYIWWSEMTLTGVLSFPDICLSNPTWTRAARDGNSTTCLLSVCIVHFATQIGIRKSTR